MKKLCRLAVAVTAAACTFLAVGGTAQAAESTAAPLTAQRAHPADDAVRMPHVSIDVGSHDTPWGHKHPWHHGHRPVA